MVAADPSASAPDTAADTVADTVADRRPDAHRAVEAVWRIEAARVIAGLARLTRDVGRAEELAQDALVLALEQWPRDGIPDNPGAWLSATARHRAVDDIRRRARYADKLATLGHDLARDAETGAQENLDDAVDDYIRDDVLRLIFTACHPLLTADTRVALTLRVVGGLSTAEIARAFLIPESTAAQRIVRAKRTLAEARVRFELPTPREAGERLAGVLGVIYLIFNEGYAARGGDAWTRPELCGEAIRLGRVLVGLTPAEAEAHGLLALMELQASRLPARTGPHGEPVLLLEQDRTRWDRLLVRRGLDGLQRAEELGGGPYTLQAAIAACHARATTADDTDWHRLADLYEQYCHRWPSPTAELNRAVAVGRAHGPTAGLAVLQPLADLPAMARHPQFHAVRADLLALAGRTTDALTDFERAAELTENSAEKAIYRRRADELARA